MDIILSFNNNAEIYILPVVPPNIPIAQTVSNEAFDGIKNKVNLIGNPDLKKVSIASFFPNKPYPFIKSGASSNGWDYVSFLNRMITVKAPFRIVFTSKQGIEVLNMPCIIDTFEYNVDKAGDIQYSLELSEYQFVKV